MLSLTKFWRHSVRVLRIKPPVPADGRHGIAIGSMVRDEARHIAEWVRFHEYAGVRQFYLYDDGSTDGTVDRAREALRDAKLTVMPWNLRVADGRSGRGLHAQALAFAHCISNFGGAFRWMAMIDPDEFLVPLKHDTLDAALGSLGDVPVISLPWVMFGRSEAGGEGVLRRFTMRARDPARAGAPGVFNTKAIFDPTAVTTVHVHRMRATPFFRGWNDRGEGFLMLNAPRPARLSADLIQLNHYYARGAEDLAAKLAKGGSFTDRAPWTGDLVERRLAAIERDMVPDSAALDYIARRDAATGRNFFAEGATR